MTPPTIRLATASPGTLATTKETLLQLEDVAIRAAANKADILLLPEAYLGGYPRGLDFGCKIGSRTEEGRNDFLRYFKGSVDLGDTVGDGAGAGEAWVKRQLGADATEARDGRSPVSRGDGTREELERIARDTGVFIVVGLVEKAGGSLYCSVVYVCPKLGVIGKRRKVQPTGSERLIWAAGSPATLKAVSTTIRGVRINLAAAICWENYMPLLRQSLYAQNVNLYLAPTADNRDAWLGLVRTVALEGRCFVVSSNMCVPEGSAVDSSAHGTATNGVSNGRRSSIVDEDGNEIVLPNGEKKISSSAVVEEAAIAPAKTSGGARTFLSRGGSAIISPFGDVIAGPQWEDEKGIIYADVDFDDCIRGRLDLDAAGSYSRNDSFKFYVEGLDLDPLPY
ncbi:carbon-nitrogen hydrolase [Annulohypoxylon truncatum]|uniref:carbon-nitrogen hydrolase n=1 Tax=Annulohypoxylon truncatum TaxID=327061 RepID=UPI002008DB64|nr:carbon-nitrogen hydrolase [Annulohypoxylon truncatum]KAI1206162.1 carbon-nitrogen hydrolase [Annulohypoxylon truncatum]